MAKLTGFVEAARSVGTGSIQSCHWKRSELKLETFGGLMLTGSSSLGLSGAACMKGRLPGTQASKISGTYMDGNTRSVGAERQCCIMLSMV
eukprot:1141479-Pelagomonas_calceolata.AAC.3